MTRKGFYKPITADMRAARYDSAVIRVETAKADGRWSEKDRLIYFIDAGLAYHFAGQYKISNAKLHTADQAVEELFTRSVSRAAASVLLNDNVLEYAGEDYENIYINLISALNYLALDNFEDAFVEIRRVNEKLDLFEQKYTDLARELRLAAQKDSTGVQLDYEPKPSKFYNDAFARYLSLHMYAAEGDYTDAQIDYDLLRDAFASQPHIYDFKLPDIRYHSKNQAVLSVVALAGLAPVKEPLSLRLRTDKDLNLVQILYDDPKMKQAEYNHVPLPVDHDYYFKFAIPQLTPRASVIDRVFVYADSLLIGKLQLLEDVTKIATATFETKKSLIFLKTLGRAITKGLANYRAKKKADSGGLKGWLKKAVIDVATDLLENPDLRSTRFLPGKVLVSDIELKPGYYNLRVDFIDTTGAKIKEVYFNDFFVRPGAFNLLEVFSHR